MEKADILEMTVRYLRSLQAEKPLHLKQRQGNMQVDYVVCQCVVLSNLA